MSHLGINIGTRTVRVVHLDDERVSFRTVGHRGRRVQALQEIFQEFGTGRFYGVCGCFGHRSEVADTSSSARKSYPIPAAYNRGSYGCLTRDRDTGGALLLSQGISRRLWRRIAATFRRA